MKSFKTFRLHQELYFSPFGQNSKSAIILEQKKSYSIRTVDNLGYDDKLDKCTNFLNPLSGPFSLKGAKHGDVITLNIEEITHTRDIGLSSCGPLPSYLLGTLKKNVVGEPVIFWKIEDDFCYPIVDNQIDRSIALKKALMIGCLRSADDLGKATISSLDADQYGGNFDCNLFKQGALIFLPIRNDNAEFYIGDVHYCQSDGEIGGTGIEITAEIKFSAHLCLTPIHKDLHVIADDFVYFFGIGPTIEDGIIKAFSQGYEALTLTGISDDMSRLLLAHGSTLKIIKLGQPNIVSIGIEAKYFSKK
ncbi:acetamidase/formamidase family protein [Pseudomonas rhodesiae]|uniref:acetamidase/formamidase family protein n=1 Tax=Pseudomonas rhodesiae TaxID=76760 RepID=UPI00215E29E0|nr:acetamidase/formamidase family protein [Pseudomonas rhodesiae]UVL10970.1 acetamidase/formamidase family protein [Pseudomonas rhodesiae]